MLRRLLIANRGEIAVRVVRACRDLGIESVVVHSEADRGSLATQLADRAVCIGPAPASQSYLNEDAVLSTAVNTGCDSVHPGYGFLSENAEFARRCAEHGLTFVGPGPEAMSLLGDKLGARATAEKVGVPIVPGTTIDPGAADLGRIEVEVGFPMLIKASAGGGGRGLRRVEHAAELGPAIDQSAAEAQAAFGDPTLYVERYLDRVRHVEVQVVGDRHGNVVHLFERDCTTQRRFQKLVEESPSPNLDESTRAAMADAACTLAQSVGYSGAGTVEFLIDQRSGDFYFIEMNTRLQVEHTVTEQLTGVDLVQLQLTVAGGDRLPFEQEHVVALGHVIEFRINAEDARHGFRPSAGTIERWQSPGGPWVRVDTHVRAGELVSPYYDSMLAKLIVWGDDRTQMLSRADRALSEFIVEGVPTTIDFHRWLLRSSSFREGRLHTTWTDDNWESRETP